MNKHCHKVIFSKTHQCFVVVSELAKSKGKSSADCRKHLAEDFFGLAFAQTFEGVSNITVNNVHLEGVVVD
ncbi:hypothetical protein BMT54_12095 [Pasteurellaceae bacterium 15-036681]|nr:hypothetical protein BMT54_12095 [Pasteurellaceae bacterium 15-036681]